MLDGVPQKPGAAAADVAALLHLTLGAVSTEGATVRDRISALEAAVEELQHRPVLQDASTQTNVSDTPEFEALKEKVEQLERLMVHGNEGHEVELLSVPVLKEDVVVQPHDNEPPLGSSSHSGLHHGVEGGMSRDTYFEQSGAEPSPDYFAESVGDSPTSCSPRGPLPPRPPSAGSRLTSRQRLRTDLPVLPPPPKPLTDARRAVEDRLVEAAPLLAREVEPLPEALSDAPVLARLARCEAMTSQVSGWQTVVRGPLRSELNGMRRALKALADRIDQLTTLKMDHGAMQTWSQKIAAQMSENIVALQVEARADRDRLEGRLAHSEMLAQKLVNELLADKADLSDLDDLRANIGSIQQTPKRAQPRSGGLSRADEERMMNLAESILRLQEMVEAKAESADLQRLEGALLAFARPRSGVTGMAPLHERLSLITPVRRSARMPCFLTSGLARGLTDCLRACAHSDDGWYR